MQKIVVNRCCGGFALSKEAYEYLNMDWDGCGQAYAFYEGDRVNQKLIEVVEKLGVNKASGESAHLEIIEIPDGVKWYIDNCGGYETVHEEHRSW